MHRPAGDAGLPARDGLARANDHKLRKSLCHQRAPQMSSHSCRDEKQLARSDIAPSSGGAATRKRTRPVRFSEQGVPSTSDFIGRAEIHQRGRELKDTLIGDGCSDGGILDARKEKYLIRAFIDGADYYLLFPHFFPRKHTDDTSGQELSGNYT